MSDCSEIVTMLSDYLDRDLPPDTCAAISRHLDVCAACGEAAESLRRTVRMCRDFRTGSRPGPLPPEKHEQLRQVFERALSEMKKPLR